MSFAAWITGRGVVSPLGCDTSAFAQGLFAGQPALRPLVLEQPGQAPVDMAVGACDFDDAAQQSKSKIPLDRGTAMALHAAKAAMGEAGLRAPGASAAAAPDQHVLAQTANTLASSGFEVDPTRLGVYWGSGMAGAATVDATIRGSLLQNKRIRPTSLVSGMPNAPMAEIAVHFGALGAAIGYACACASAAVAMGEALWALRAGRIDVAIVGGSEAFLVPGGLGAWHAMRVLSPPGHAPSLACRPFATNRAGFAVGEGAAAFVLETPEHARRRGAQTSLALSGYATTCDGRHLTLPDTAGQVRAIRAALANAGLTAQDIGHVNSHGTATVAGDAAEAAALAQVFGPKGVPVTATKAQLGHSLGAGGAIEFLATLCALERAAVPPTAHVVEVDPALAIDLVQDQPRALQAGPSARHAISNSFAFGGTNAVLVASRLHAT